MAKNINNISELLKDVIINFLFLIAIKTVITQQQKKQKTIKNKKTFH